MSVQEAVELFRGEEIAVRLYQRGGAACVITFDHYQSDSSLDRKAFGEDFLAHLNISAIHVMSRTNSWYQHAEITPALAAVKNAAGAFDRAIAYGSSMGAYAAIRFADRAGATEVVALSPQYSVRRKIMPREIRWRRDSKTIAWAKDADGPIVCGVKPIVFYDSNGLDGYQVKRIRQDIEIVPIDIRYSAHPISSYLNYGGYLTTIIPQVIDGSFDPEEARRYLRSIRGDNLVYLCELSMVQPAHRAKLRIRLAEKAVEVSNGYNLACHTLAHAWTAVRDFSVALPYHKQAVEKSDGHLGFLIPYQEALLKAGDAAESVLVAQEIVAKTEQAGWALARLARVQWYAFNPVGKAFFSIRHAAFSLAWKYFKIDLW